MNLSTSQCTSSGCESGWTMYLDQSSVTKNQYNGNFGRFVEDEEEDLSMVSDASSGPPPHYFEEDYFDESAKKSKNKKKGKEHDRTQQYLYLDDTASSPELGKKMTQNEDLEFSQGFSATHFKGKSGIKKHFGFFKSEKTVSKEPGGYQGRKWK